MTADEALARIAEQQIPETRTAYIWCALGELLLFDYVVRARGYKVLAKWVGERRPVEAALNVQAEWVAAVDLACVWYWKSPACLQRSTVLARLLRRAGIAAEVVIGVQQFPFKSHAWVEVDRIPANERRRVGEAYMQIDRWN